MVNTLLTNKSLKKFIKDIKISQERKSFLLSKLSQLDEEERKKLFNVLKEVHLLDLEEAEAIQKIKKYWR